MDYGVRNPRNIRGGALGGDVIGTIGDPYDVDVNNELNIYYTARAKVFDNARSIIGNRIKNQMMAVFHGAAATLYGLQFVYDAGSGSWRAAVSDANSFVEHILGIADTGKRLRDIEAEWVKSLLNIQNMPPMMIVTGDPRPGIT